MATLVLPSVTQVLGDVGLGPDLSSIDPAILATASARGTLVHQAIEAEHYGGLDDMEVAALPEPVRVRFLGYRKFVAETKHKPIVSEIEMVHPAWQYIGHGDRVGWQGKDRTFVDWKCVVALSVDSVSYQLAAYRMAWEATRPAEPISRVWAVQLLPGDYRVHDVTDRMREATQVFQAALIVWRARARKESA